MKTMKIFEPAMCCPTGLCGVSVDPELLRISTVLNTLQQNGIEVQRFNLTSAPAEFVKNKAVTEYLQKFAPEKLPVVLVDDFIVIAGRYPTNEEFTNWLELPENMLGVSCCEEIHLPMMNVAVIAAVRRQRIQTAVVMTVRNPVVLQRSLVQILQNPKDAAVMKAAVK